MISGVVCLLVASIPLNKEFSELLQHVTEVLVSPGVPSSFFKYKLITVRYFVCCRNPWGGVGEGEPPCPPRTNVRTNGRFTDRSRSGESIEFSSFRSVHRTLTRHLI